MTVSSDFRTRNAFPFLGYGVGLRRPHYGDILDHLHKAEDMVMEYGSK